MTTVSLKVLDDRVRPIDLDGRPGEYGRETARRVHQELKKLGTVRSPAEFVFMDRAAIGLGGVFLHLDAELNFHRLFEAEIEGFSVERVAQRQGAAMRRVGLLTSS